MIHIEYDFVDRPVRTVMCHRIVSELYHCHIVTVTTDHIIRLVSTNLQEL